MPVAPLRISSSAEEDQHQHFILALWLLEQGLDVRAQCDGLGTASSGHLRCWIQLDFKWGKQGARAMPVAPLRISSSAEEAQHKLFILALRLWEQGPDVRAQCDGLGTASRGHRRCCFRLDF